MACQASQYQRGKALLWSSLLLLSRGRHLSRKGYANTKKVCEKGFVELSAADRVTAGPHVLALGFRV